MLTFVAVMFLGLVALLIFVAVRSILLGRRLQQLEDRMAVLERSVRGLSARSPSSAPTTLDVTTPASAAPTVPSQQPSTAPPITIFPPPPPSRTREEWEAFVGGRLLNRIGAFAVIIGIGFFLKHAFDNNWISEPVRVLIGVTAGAVSLVIAHRTHQKGFSIFSQGLVGAGIGILYLSVYATFNFYALLPQIPSFILMTGVTALALAQGVRYRSLAVAVLGWAGGYLTPWMLSTGEASEVRLFGYLALLTVGILGLAVRMPAWTILQPLTAAGTWLWFFVWYGDAYTPDAFLMTLFFLIVFWGAFVAADHVQTRGSIGFDWARRSTLMGNALLAILAVGRIVEPESQNGAGLLLVLMGAAYPVFLVTTTASSSHDRPYIVVASLAALVFFCLGTEWIFAEYPDAGVWALLAWVAAAVGRMRQWPHLLVASQVLVLLAVAQLLSVDGVLATEHVRDFVPVLGWRTVGYAGLAVGALLGFLSLPADHPRRWERELFLLVAASALSLFITVEVNDMLRVWRLDLDPDPIAFRWFLSLLLIGLLWILLGAGAFLLGLRDRLPALLGLGVFLLGIGSMMLAFRGLFVPVIQYHNPILNVRVLTMLGGAGLLLVCTFAAMRRRDALLGAAALPQIFAVAAVAIVFSMLTGEAADWFERFVVAARDAGAEVLADLRDEQQLSISIVWLLYSVALMAVGFWRSNRGMRFIAMGLFAMTILKIFLYDLSSLETGYRIVSFIGLGGILLGVSYGYQRFKHLLV